jgi:hypothetical protein
LTKDDKERETIKQQIKDKLDAIKKLVAEEVSKKEFDLELAARIDEMKADTEIQKLLNSGKGKEAFIQGEINSAQSDAKAKNQTLSNSVLDELRAAAGAKYDVERANDFRNNMQRADAGAKYDVERANDFRNNMQRADLPNDSLSSRGIYIGESAAAGSGAGQEGQRALNQTVQTMGKTVAELGRKLDDVKMAIKSKKSGGVW